MPEIVPNLWFDSNAPEAAQYYVSVFPNSKITSTTYYVEDSHGQPGSVMTVGFNLDELEFTAINGGSYYKINPAVSFLVLCQTQEEIDYYWEKLSGDPNDEQCGWVKDKFGVSWQIVPKVLQSMIENVPKEKASAVMNAVLKMKKIIIADLEKAFREA